MTPEQLQVLKDRLIKAVDQHLANGGTLTFGQFYGLDRDKCRCPISCLIGEYSSDTLGLLKSALGFEITDEEMWQFVHGFDGYTSSFPTEIYQLGQELRQKYRGYLKALW